jgi:hypothetical protein
MASVRLEVAHGGLATRVRRRRLRSVLRRGGAAPVAWESRPEGRHGSLGLRLALVWPVMTRGGHCHGGLRLARPWRGACQGWLSRSAVMAS